MMNYLSRGDILQRNGEWLIIDISDKFCLFVMLNTTKTKISCHSTEEVLYWLDYEEETELVSNNFTPKEPFLLFETEASQRINERIRSMATELLGWEDTLFWLADRECRVNFIHSCSEKYDVSVHTVRRFLRNYLQNNLSLLNMKCKYHECGGRGKEKNYKNGKRPGRKGISRIERNETVIAQFETARKRFLRNKARITYSMLYQDMCQKYYSTKKVVNGEVKYEMYAAVNRPTIRQLIYYMHKHVSDAEEYIAEHGVRTANNNIRPLKSDTIACLPSKTIGSRFEMDEMETDFYLVSRNDRNKLIGKGILYMLVDVYSKMIVGVNVGVDNNSWDGAKLALLNMVEDKVNVCKRTGIDIKNEDWPVSGVFPYQIMSDNGVEYQGNAIQQYALENGIQLTNPPSKMASYKPNIEQKFHQFNRCVKGLLPGEIIKESYGASHLKEARLTIEEFYKVVLQFVLYYNKTPLTNYQADKEVFDAGILPSPINIWNLKAQGTTMLKKVQNFDFYKYSLLTESKASITREGIVFKEIIYTCSDEVWLQKMMYDVSFNGRKKMTIRYDRRNMDFIYFLIDGQIATGWINPNKTSNEKYMGCSYSGVLEINQRIKEQKLMIADERLENSVNFNSKVKEIVRDSKKKHTGINHKNYIRENRNEEKQALHKETQICINEYESMNVKAIECEERILESGPKNKVEQIDTSELTTAELFAMLEKEKYEKFLKKNK